MKSIKKKLGMLCLAVLITVMSSIPVLAAETGSESQTGYNLPDFEVMSAQATVNDVCTGSNYEGVWLNITCYCYLIGTDQVQSVTAKSGSTVMIESKSYETSSITSQNGSGGNANVNSTSVSYTASSSVYYTAQVHSDVTNNNVAYILLYRY